MTMSSLVKVFEAIRPASGISYLYECEALRGVAVLLVVFFHMQGSVLGYQPKPDAGLVESFIFAGNTGVTLFFVLSGFLLTLPFLKPEPISMRSFYINRSLRIYPLYLIGVFVAAAYTGKWWAGLKSAVFIDVTLTSIFPFSNVWWSLVTEIQFYVVLPLLFYLFIFPKRYWLLAILGVGLVAIYCALLLQWPYDIDPGLRAKLMGMLPGRWLNFFAGGVGAMLYVNYQGTMKKFWSSVPLLGDMALLLVLLALAIVLRKSAMMGIFASEVNFAERHALEGFLWGGVILISVTADNLLLKKVPTLGFFSFIGVLAYSIYLFHSPILFYTLKATKRQLPDYLASYETVIGMGLFILLALVISIITYLLLERPFLLYKRKRSSK